MRARVASACARRARARKNTPALQRYFNTSASKYTTHYVDGLELSRLHHLKSFDPMITNMITNSSATDSRYLLIGQDFNMSHRCDMLGSLLPRWTSGYDINLITLVFLDQIARVAQWTTRLPYLKMRMSRSGMSRSLLSNLGILGQHVTPV